METSYNYLRPQDNGRTIWVPLDPIRLDGQRGGMSVVPRSVYSGNDVMKLIYRMINQHLESPDVIMKAFAFERAHREFVWPILDGAEVELPFELGDALLFDRDLWHRSCPFLQGTMARRRAFILRFIDGEAQLDAQFYDQICMFSKQTGWPIPSTFGRLLQKSIANGARIREAPDVRPF